MGQRARLKSNIKKNGLNDLNKMKVWFKDERLAHWPRPGPDSEEKVRELVNRYKIGIHII